MISNKIIWVVIIIVALAIFVYSRVNTNPSSILSGYSEENCPEEVKLDRMILICREGLYYKGKIISSCGGATNMDLGITSDYASIGYKWKDGQDIRADTIRDIVRGQEEGENINYLYMINSLTYKKEIKEVDETGKIIEQKDLLYNVRFVFDFNDKTDEGYKIIESSCKIGG